MDTVTVTEAKASLSRLLQRVLDGEEIAIGRRGKPEVVLRRLADDTTPRTLGGFEDGFRMAADFDDPIPELEAGLYGDDATSGHSS